MRLFLALVLPVLVFGEEIKVVPLPVGNPAETGMSVEELNKVGPIVQGFITEKKLAGANVLVLRKGKIVYQESFGLRDVNLGKPMEKDTLFRIYSMTKALTSAAAMMLCEEGKLSLDDPIGKYLPELAKPEVLVTEGHAVPAGRKPTVRDLLRHTGGFASLRAANLVSQFYREGLPGLDKRTLEDLVGNIGKSALMYQPGERWVYGVSSDLLAAVVAQAARKPFEDVITTRLIKPLGMVDTAYSVPAGKADRLSTSYRTRKVGGLGILDPAGRSRVLKDPSFKGGGSGLVSTITDYARFLQMIANGGEFQGRRYLREDTVNLMRTNQLPRNLKAISFGEEERHGTGFGLGFCVRYAHDDRWDADAAIGEYGWGGAASTHYWISPKHDLVVITMEQTMPYNWNLEHSLKPVIYGAVLK